MKFRDTQKEVDDWVKQYQIGYWKPLEILARLTEETGELAREISHRFGPKKKKAGERRGDIGGEIADILFTLTCLANSLHLDMDRDFKNMLNKYYTRDKKRWKKRTRE